MQATPTHRLYSIIPGERHHEIYIVTRLSRTLREELIALESRLTAETQECTFVRDAIAQTVEAIPPLDDRVNRAYRAWKHDRVQAILTPGLHTIRCRVDAMARANAQGRSHQSFLAQIILRSSNPAPPPAQNPPQDALTLITPIPPPVPTAAFGTGYSPIDVILDSPTGPPTEQPAASLSLTGHCYGLLPSSSVQNNLLYSHVQTQQPQAAYHPSFSDHEATYGHPRGATPVGVNSRHNAPVSRATSSRPFSVSGGGGGVPPAAVPPTSAMHPYNYGNSSQYYLPPPFPPWNAYEHRMPRSAPPVPAPPAPWHRPFDPNIPPLAPPSEEEILEAMDVAHRLIEVIDVAVTLIGLMDGGASRT